MPRNLNPIVEIEEVLEFRFFSKFVAKKRAPLTEKEERKLLTVFQDGVLGNEYFINIADSVPKEHKGLLPSLIFIKRGLISCKCHIKTGYLCGVWPNNQETICKKQQLLLSTLYATICDALSPGYVVVVVNGVLEKHPDSDVSSMYRELCIDNQHATQSD
mgnify:FL=1